MGRLSEAVAFINAEKTTGFQNHYLSKDKLKELRAKARLGLKEKPDIEDLNEQERVSSVSLTQLL